MTPTQSGGSSSSATAGHTAQTVAGPFMLTLCRLASPVPIRPPRSPRLKPFTFFTSRSRRPDGSERLYLHMGYFATLTDAQKWAQLMHGAYPNAIATLAPTALLRQPNSGIPTLRSVDGPRRVPATATQEWAPAEDLSLTDTQVLAILETRRVTPIQDNTAERNGAQISLLRPEDTGTRQVLKEAVVQGAPVSFAVQLHRSVQPIDLSSVPALSVFQAFTLYATEGRRDGRSWYCLRLGFFRDAIAAKQVAYYVRPSFSSAAVVPVTEQECTRANETLIHLSALADPVQQRIGPALDSDRARPNPASSGPAATHPAPAQTVKTSSSTSTSGSTVSSKGTKSRAPSASRGRAETLQETLELLAARELRTDADSLSESSVRHLKVEVQKGTSRRS
jgi:hypothetical protein